MRACHLTEARSDSRWCATCRSAQLIADAAISTRASRRSRPRWIKAARQFRCKRKRVCQQRGIVTGPPLGSSVRLRDRGPFHRGYRPRFQCHLSQSPREPEVAAQGRVARFFSPQPIASANASIYPSRPLSGSTTVTPTPDPRISNSSRGINSPRGPRSSPSLCAIHTSARDPIRAASTA